MDTKWEIDQGAFEKMLNWLHDDREIAGKKYEAIRIRLIKILSYRGCNKADELADETFDRVAKKIDSLADSYVGKPELYFFGVANNVYREFLREPKLQELPYALQHQEVEIQADFPEYNCLQKCLKTLPREKRDFIVNYYEGEKIGKIDNRKDIAEDMNVKLGGLRVRAYRLRAKLQKCVYKCIEKK